MKYFGDLPWYLNVDNDNNVIMTRLWKATLTIKLTIIVNRHKCVNTPSDCQWGLDNENSVIMVIKQRGIKNKREIFSLVIFDALDLYQITQMVSFTYLLVVLLLIVLFAVSSQILFYFLCDSTYRKSSQTRAENASEVNVFKICSWRQMTFQQDEYDRETCSFLFSFCSSEQLQIPDSSRFRCLWIMPRAERHKARLLSCHLFSASFPLPFSLFSLLTYTAGSGAVCTS